MNPTQLSARTRSALRMGNIKGSVAAVVISSLSLLHFNGADASTTISDVGSRGATWSAAGNAQLDTAQKKFGSASLLLDGTGDYVLSSDIGALPASGGWTIEGWVRIPSLPTFPAYRMFGWHKTSDGAKELSIDLVRGSDYGVSGYRLIVLASSASGAGDIFAGNSLAAGTKNDFTIDTWYHIAIVRDDSASAYYLYVDGALDLSKSSVLQVSSTISELSIGAQAVPAIALAQGFFNGWIEEFRIYGTCLYPGGTTFTPSSVEYSS